MVLVLWKSFLTVVGIIVVVAVRYSSKIYDRHSWVNVENTDLADLADEEGNYLPGVKALFYVWIPYILIAMWANVPAKVDFAVLGFLFISWRVYSAFVARRCESTAQTRGNVHEGNDASHT